VGSRAITPESDVTDDDDDDNDDDDDDDASIGFVVKMPATLRRADTGGAACSV
jgi:hypothetical protein